MLHGSDLRPNNLLLGRATSKVPNEPFQETENPRQRFAYMLAIIINLWTKWTRDYFQNLIISYRNTEVGDIVLIIDSNAIRGQWKL